MKLDCYRIGSNAAEIVPARPERAWMNATHNRFAYRCTPLTMANSTGWDLLCPVDIEATWNGGAGRADVAISGGGGAQDGHGYVQSHFGHGVLTFLPGYLFRTDPEWALWCRGAPNVYRDGITPLEGLVETDWLPFTFTMNWRFTRPGTVHFKRGEPFCFITPVPHIAIESIRPRILPLGADPALKAEHDAWEASRTEFNQRLDDKDPGALKDKWQRYYLKGAPPRGQPAPDTHRVKRRMAEPTSAPSDRRPRRCPVASGPASDTATATAQNIIWIASYPKSGNTWVRAFLHNLIREIQGQDDHVQDINQMHEQTAWEVPGGPFEALLGHRIANASHADLARVRPEVQRLMANGRTSPFFVKTHLAVGMDNDHPTVNLDATLAAVYVVRNPLDVAVSYAHHAGHTLDVTIANMGRLGLKTLMTEKDVYEVIGSWSQSVASWMGVFQRPVHVVRYEDLLKDSFRYFGTLAAFLRLAPSETQLRSAIAKSSFAALSQQEREKGFNERPQTSQRFFREGREGRWTDVLSAAQVQAIVRAHAPMMQRFGYLPPAAGAKAILSSRFEDGAPPLATQVNASHV